MDTNDTGVGFRRFVTSAAKLIVMREAKRTKHVLLVVITSRATQDRALLAHSTWCASKEIACRFVADQPFRGSPPTGLAWSVLRSAAPPPGSCCRRGKGFFCSPHRQHTLAAQYRYLPALHRAGIAQLALHPSLRWVVLVDDDAFIFVENLVRAATTSLHLG